MKTNRVLLVLKKKLHIVVIIFESLGEMHLNGHNLITAFDS